MLCSCFSKKKEKAAAVLKGDPPGAESSKYTGDTSIT